VMMEMVVMKWIRERIRKWKNGLDITDAVTGWQAWDGQGQR
jgi:hypothetical protein